MNDITLPLQVMAKIFSGMFLTGEGIAVLALFSVATIAFLTKAKLNG
jgi:hypothetical protein